jgi:putative two-component system hydrogenase maturation factor HypX/HoxX
VRVSTADGAVWIGHLRRPGGPKLPARDVLADHVRTVDSDAFTSVSPGPNAAAPGDIRYRRIGAIGWISFDFYNGAMSTDHCRRLLAAFGWAQQQDTRVIVLRGGDNVFSNGIHLNVIEAARHSATAAWANIAAMDDLCRAIITCTEQLVVAGVSGNAGAGGVMMSLGADVVAARSAVVLNPHYATMGLFGSEYWTYTLPGRVGAEAAFELTERCLPVGDREALRLGLVDRVCSRDPARYDEELLDLAEDLAGRGWREAVAAKGRRREADETALPLETFRARELSRMAADFFDDDRHAGLRRAFVSKERPTATPANIALHRESDRDQNGPAVASPRAPADGPLVRPVGGSGHASGSAYREAAGQRTS